MPDERRRLPRFACHLRASVMIDGQMFEAMCTDIGRGGAFLATAVMAAPGTRLSVAIASPHATSMIAAQAEVRYTVRRSATRPTGLAVHWLEMTPNLNRVIAVVEGGPSLAAAQADTSPVPVGVPSDPAGAKTAPYQATPARPSPLPTTQRTRQKP